MLTFSYLKLIFLYTINGIVAIRMSKLTNPFMRRSFPETDLTVPPNGRNDNTRKTNINATTKRKLSLSQ